MTILIVFAGLGATGLFLLIRAAVLAPEGYEDASGFHLIKTEKAGAQTPASAPLPTADVMSFGR